MSYSCGWKKPNVRSSFGAATEISPKIPKWVMRRVVRCMLKILSSATNYSLAGHWGEWGLLFSVENRQHWQKHKEEEPRFVRSWVSGVIGVGKMTINAHIGRSGGHCLRWCGEGKEKWYIMSVVFKNKIRGHSRSTVLVFFSCWERECQQNSIDLPGRINFCPLKYRTVNILVKRLVITKN